MKKNVLLLYYSSPLSFHTIQDNINSFRSLSKNNIMLLNTYPKAKIPEEVNISDFDGVLIDSTLAYFPKMLEELDENTQIKLKDYEGVKVLLKQNEHIHSHETARIIGQKKIDLVFTCLNESQISKVYPPHFVGKAQFVQQLTGYFSDALIRLANSIDYTRSIDISYRGSIQPLEYGRLGFEKWNIGQSISNKLLEKQIKVNISSNWADRIYGNDWIKFLSCSKSVLGVESGSNLFDFNGEIEKKCRSFEQMNNHFKKKPEVLYEEAHKEFLFQYEDNVKYAQISSRHFEAAATRTLQILYEGDYSGIFVPYRHFLPLKRDLSNLEEIQEVLFNSSKRGQITDCAFDEIVMNERFHYRSKVQQFDSLIEQISIKKNIRSSTSNKLTIKNQNNIVILVPHEPHLDPRIEWLKEGLDDLANTITVGTTHCEKHIKWRMINDHTLEANLDYIGLSKLTMDYEVNVYSDYYRLLHLLNSFFIKDGVTFLRSGFYSNESIERFRWYINYFIKTDRALRFLTNQMVNSNSTPPSLLVCCDLSSLLSGVILAQQYKVPLVYDAHEFWAYSDDRSLPWEIDFWTYYERVLLKYVDFPITVSKSLTEKMSQFYMTNFTYIPNAVNIKNALNLKRKKFQMDLLFDDIIELPDFENPTVVKFLFMGGYAPGRGLEQLIDAWKGVPENSKLILRGKYWQYTDELVARAKLHGLYNKTVFFFKAVGESELISMASTFDVGIIPYDQSTNINNKYCCPNKLSQYMAAGIPILSNKLIEVERIITKANCGFVVNFNLELELVEIINQLTNSSLRKQMGNAAREYFLKDYNWDKQAAPLYEKLKMVLNDQNKISFIRMSVQTLPVSYNNMVDVVDSNTSKFFKEFFKASYRLLKHLIVEKVKIFNPILKGIKQANSKIAQYL